MAEGMIRPYSQDLRERAVALVDEGASSLEAAEALGVSDSWVRKMRLRRERLGHLMPGSPPGKVRILKEVHEERLCGLVFDHPDATLEELVELVAKHLRIRVSFQTLSRRLIELGLTRKKRLSTPRKPTDPRSSKNANGSSVEGPFDGRPACFSSTRPASTSR